MIASPAGEVTSRTSPIVVVTHHFAGAVVDHEESFARVSQAPEVDAVGWAEPFVTVDEERVNAGRKLTPPLPGGFEGTRGSGFTRQRQSEGSSSRMVELKPLA
jgi:hypothetical protein